MKNAPGADTTYASQSDAWRAEGDRSPTSTRQAGEMVIGKINLILIGLIVVILFGLISKEDSSPALATAPMRIQSQGEATESAPASSAPTVVAEAPPAVTEPAQTVAPPSKPEHKPVKRSKKPGAPEETWTGTAAAPASGTTPVTETQPHASSSSAEVGVSKEAARKMIVFNIWSVSELRLRTAYARYLNDSAVPATQLDIRKKEYLNFVSHRSKHCGELDNKFPSNINTVEKLTITKSEVLILECHAAENNIELDKLNI